MCRRGEIYYISNADTYYNGAEVKPARPAIVVSNDKCNMFSNFIEVVYMTTQEKTDLPTHVTVNATGRKSTALCEKICSISTDRIGDYVAICTDQEMEMIDIALAVSLGIDFKRSEETSSVMEDIKTCKVNEDDKLRSELLKVRTECELYKKLYEQLMEKVVK